MEVPLVALASRMTRLAVGRRRSHPLISFYRLALGSIGRAERFCGVQPGLYDGQDARETHVGSQIGRRGEVDVCPTTEPDARALVRAIREWIRNDLWRLDCDGLKESHDVFVLVCCGGQLLGGGQLCLTCIFRLPVLCIHDAFDVFVVVSVFPAGDFPFLCPLRDGLSENLQNLARVRLPVEYCSLRREWREEERVAPFGFLYIQTFSIFFFIYIYKRARYL